MWIFSKLFGLFFSKHKHHVYTAFGYEEYLKIVNVLEAAGISFRTVTRYSLSSPVRMSSPRDHQNVPYDIYVKREDEHKARTAIHHRQM